MRNIIFRNFGLKVSALLLSVFLWIFVTSRGQSEMTVEIPLEFKNIPAGLGIVLSSAKTVSLTVRGQERLVKGVKASDIRVYIDLSKAKAGEAVFYIGKDDIKAPYAIRVMNITPSSVKVRMDETVSASMPVRPVVTGSPERGFTVWGLEVEPRTVAVRGLKSEVARIRSLPTEPLDLTGLTDTVTQAVRIDLAGTNIQSETETVKVKVHITGRKK